MRRVVVVGAGPSGARCAERLAEAGLAPTLIGAEPGQPYNRVALSQFLAGELAEAALVTHHPERLADLRVRYRPATRIIAIDRPAKQIVSETGERIAYDALVLALGAHAVRLNLPGAHLPGVLLYRTLDEVRVMLRAARTFGRAAVVGGGLLGLEAAAGLARRGMAVTVVHGADRLMERQLDSPAARLLAARLRRGGVEVHLSASTAAVEGGVRAEGVRLGDGTLIPADLVVFAVGIRPETALAKAAGLDVGRGIQVDDTMRTSDPHIWAVGECAEHGGMCVGLVAPALAQAEVAAATIAGTEERYAPVSDATSLKVAGAPVWSAGVLEGEESISLDDADAGEYRRLVLRDGRLVGAIIYGEVGDAAWYRGLIEQAQPIAPIRAALPFGPAFIQTPR